MSTDVWPALMPQLRQLDPLMPPPAERGISASHSNLMPKFFFNMVDGEFLRDPEGLILGDLDSAREIALRSAREMMAEQVKQGELSMADRIEIMDEQGALLACVKFQDAVTIRH